MLNRIALCTLVASLLILHVVRAKVKGLDTLLSKLPETGEILGVKLSLGTIVMALLITFLARAVKLHDRLSDFFRIRRNFDVQEILVPLTEKTLGAVSEEQLSQIERHRHDLMSKVFYKYASGSPNRAMIEPHLIECALDQWTWFWCLLEATVLLCLAAVLLLLSGQIQLALTFFGIIAGCVILMIWMRQHCAQNAAKEIEAILADAGRKHEIAEVMRAVQG